MSSLEDGLVQWSLMDGPTHTAVVIPVFNDQVYIGDAIRSVLAQTLPPETFVVADNASTDATRAVAASLVANTNLAVVPRNIGMAGNFQRAVRLVDSELFAWLGSDDRLDPQFMSSTTQALAANPEAQAVVTGVRLINALGDTVATVANSSVADADVRQRLRGYLSLERWTEVYGLYRRGALLRSPGFRECYGPDVILIWWFLLRGPLAFVAQPLYEYRIAEKSMRDALHRIDPTMIPRRRTENTDLWFGLLAESLKPDIPARTRSIATMELIRALDVTLWRDRIDEDEPHLRRRLLILLRDAHRARQRKHGALSEGGIK